MTEAGLTDLSVPVPACLPTHAGCLLPTHSTFDASDVTADVLVEPVGVDLLLVEVGQVLLEDIVRRPVGLAQVLHELQPEVREGKSGI